MMVFEATDIVQNDQRTVDTSNGVVADAWLDVHHPGVYSTVACHCSC